MSSMMDSLHQDQPAQSGAPHFAMGVPSFRIKRPGARPLAFDGIELAMAMSFTPTLPYWYEVNLYRTTDQRFVTCVRLFYQAEDEQDTVRAWDFDTLDQALDKLAHYDAGQDLRVQFDPSETASSAAELAACAMDVRARLMAKRRHYESLVGEFFYELDTAKFAQQRARA